MNSRCRSALCAMAMLASSLPFAASSAGYDSNMKGVVTQLLTYGDDAMVLFALSNQPATHPACNATYFALDRTLSADLRKQIYSRLLAAYVTKETVNIGYDSTGGCAGSYIRAWRVG